MPHIGEQRWDQSVDNAGNRVFTRHGSGPETDYSELKKEELQELLEERDLPKTGKKDELVERLQESEVASS